MQPEHCLIALQVDITIDDFNRIGDKVPLISKLKPHGSYSYSKNLHDIEEGYL